MDVRQRIARIHVRTIALLMALRDPRTPWTARLLGGLVAAYAFSPIDLIPDFVPLLGYLDDLVIVPLGLWLTVRLIPAEVWSDCLARAAGRMARPTSWAGAAMVIAIWLALAALAGWWIWLALR